MEEYKKIDWKNPELITVRRLTGLSEIAYVTTSKPASSYGIPVVVDEDGDVYGTADTAGWELLSAHLLGLERLAKAGYPMVLPWAKELARLTGAKGGSAKSAAKAKAARESGKRGGRPRKDNHHD